MTNPHKSVTWVTAEFCWTQYGYQLSVEVGRPLSERHAIAIEEQVKSQLQPDLEDARVTFQPSAHTLTITSADLLSTDPESLRSRIEQGVDEGIEAVRTAEEVERTDGAAWLARLRGVAEHQDD